MNSMTFDEAEYFSDKLGINLAHDCNERAKECACEWEGHASGDVSCANRETHTACSHDLAKIAEANRITRL